MDICHNALTVSEKQLSTCPGSNYFLYILDSKLITLFMMELLRGLGMLVSHQVKCAISIVFITMKMC